MVDSVGHRCSMDTLSLPLRDFRGHPIATPSADSAGLA